MTAIIPLPDEVVEEKSKTLESLLWCLIEYIDSEDTIETYSKVLSDIYSQDYRQMYSEIYPILCDIYVDDELNLEAVIGNLAAIKNHIHTVYDEKGHSEKYGDELYGKVLKLIDHVNLEYQRLVENISHSFELEAERKELERRLELSTQNLDHKLDEITSKIKNIQIELVTILGIFAAIVVAFSGGLSFIGSTTSNIASAEICNLICITSLCGLVLFNTLTLLLLAIYSIINSHSTSIKSTLNEIIHMPAMLVFAISDIALIIVFIWSLSVCL